MPNSNPQAIRFVNERCRPVCDRLAQSYHLVNAILTQVRAEGVDGLFVEDKDAIQDGSERDGRSPVSNEDIKGLLSALAAYRDFFDQSTDVRDLILRVAVNPLQGV